MKIISFGWTVPALKALIKDTTRRDWAKKYALSFHEGDLVQAWDKSPRAHGQRFGTIQLTEDPQLSNMYPEEDYWREGLKWMALERMRINGEQPRTFWERWKEERPKLWVIRFKIIDIYREDS